MATKSAKRPRRQAARTTAGRIYGGMSAAERRAERRSRLMTVGLDLFGTVGYQKTTIPMLCSAAGVTARHFYEDFASREELLRALYDRISDTMQTVVVDALRASEATMHDRIRASNVAYFKYLTGDPRVARVYALESRGVSPEMEQHRRAKRENIVQRLTKATRRLEQSGFDTALDSRLVSAAIAGAAHDLVLEWVLATRRPSVQRMVDTLTALWVRTLLLDTFEPPAASTYRAR